MTMPYSHSSLYDSHNSKTFSLIAQCFPSTHLGRFQGLSRLCCSALGIDVFIMGARIRMMSDF